ncbi:MAG: GTP-binding protein [Acidiferrobacterales bacterium]|nr:GTP-binding protein [Acidiferrobacterales bacterium]
MNDAPKKKICLIGEFAVGKTSLTQKFVNNVFSDKYLTTVGVKIDTAFVDGTKLVVWDIAGRDSISPINLNYLVGAAGIILVADGTREETITSIPDFLNTVEERLGEVPCIVALNKYDSGDWQVDDLQIEEFRENGIQIMQTSAKDGRNVDRLFSSLVAKFA